MPRRSVSKSLKEWLYAKELINDYDLTPAAARFWKIVKDAEEYHKSKVEYLLSTGYITNEDDYEPDFGSLEDEQAYNAWRLLEGSR